MFESLAGLVSAYFNGVGGILNGLAILIAAWLVGGGIFWYLFLSGITKAMPFLKWLIKWSVAAVLAVIASIFVGFAATPIAGLGVLGGLGLAIVNRAVHDIKKPMQVEKSA